MRKNLLCLILLSWVVLVCLVDFACCQQNIEVVVTRGDSLINICKAYLDDPNEWPQVAKANRLVDPHWIYPGQGIVIPAHLLKGVPIDGLVTFVKGVAEVKSGDTEQWNSLELNDRVKQDSWLRTGPESALEISFDDGASFFMWSDTSLGLTKSRDRGMVFVVRELFLEAGRVVTHIRKSTGRESRFEVVTPAATAAARGTDFRTSNDAKDDTRVEVLSGMVTTEARRRRVVLNEGQGTLVRKGEQPIPARQLLPAPVLANPEPLYRRLPVAFRFDRVEGAVSYRVMLAKDSSLKEVLKEQVISPAEIFQIPTLDDGAYYLRALSIDRLGLEGLPSDAVTIKVRINPVPPFIQAPANGKEYRTKKLVFSWLKVPDAAEYEIQIAADEAFSDIVQTQERIITTAYEAKHLPFGSYHFRIRSVAKDGYKGIWSDVLRFTLSPPPPVPPADPPEMSKGQINVHWQNLGDGISYHFQMAKDKDFQEIVVEEKVKASEITLETPKSSGTYYVRISGIDADGYEGSFSPPQSFEVTGFPYAVLGTALAIGTMVIIMLP